MERPSGDQAGLFSSQISLGRNARRAAGIDERWLGAVRADGPHLERLVAVLALEDDAGAVRRPIGLEVTACRRAVVVTRVSSLPFAAAREDRAVLAVGRGGAHERDAPVLPGRCRERLCGEHHAAHCESARDEREPPGSRCHGIPPPRAVPAGGAGNRVRAVRSRRSQDARNGSQRSHFWSHSL